MDLRISARNGLRSGSSERKQPMKSKTGEAGEQSRSESKIALSTSPHWRSSIEPGSRASGSPSRAKSSRRPANARRLSSCWSGISERLAPGQRNRLDALQHRKNTGQKGDVGRQQARHHAPGSPFK